MALWSVFHQEMFYSGLVFSSTVLANSLDSSHSSFLVIASGILTGILIHDIGLLSMVSVSRKFMSQLFIKRVSIVAGIVLLGFAAYFGYEFVDGLLAII